MKTQHEIAARRLEVVNAVRDFRDIFDLPTCGSSTDPRVAFYMALGVLAATDFALDLRRPDNLGVLIESMEKTIGVHSFTIPNNEETTDGTHEED
jgi:hypothetical protein